MGVGCDEHFAIRRFIDTMVWTDTFARLIVIVAGSFPQEFERYVRYDQM